MNIDKKIDLLKQIKDVDTPPFLLTRIKQQIHNLADAEAPVQWKWAFAVSSIFLLAFNVSILFGTKTTEVKKAGIEEVVNSMQLSSTNSFYND